tara:strand:+ start:2077 stop:2367 length:291 start_codon:yes stop_codon:yes gene_type:complete
MGIYMSAIRTGPWFIDTDGKTVLTWKCIDFKETILLSDGRKLKESQYMGNEQCVGRIFASHPEHNPNIRKDLDGVYFWAPTGQSFKTSEVSNEVTN